MDAALAELPVAVRTDDWSEVMSASLRLETDGLTLFGPCFESTLGSAITLRPRGDRPNERRSIFTSMSRPWFLGRDRIWWLTDEFGVRRLGCSLHFGGESIELFLLCKKPCDEPKLTEHMTRLFGELRFFQMEASPRMPWYRRWFGNRSERAAERFLKAKGLRIITRNWSCGLGELDLIARDGQTLVFVEVRSTEGPSTEGPGASVDEEKRQRLSRLGLAFIQKHGLGEVNARFDVLLVSWPPGRKEPRIEHYPNAFEVRGKFQMRA